MRICLKLLILLVSLVFASCDFGSNTSTSYGDYSDDYESGSEEYDDDEEYVDEFEDQIAYVDDSWDDDDDEDQSPYDAYEVDNGRDETYPKHYIMDVGVSKFEMWEYEDGSMSIKTRMSCYSCHGTRMCTNCQGTGNGYYAINRYMPCVACGAKGTCGTCNGEGYVENVQYWEPGEAEAYLAAHKDVEREYQRQGGSLGRSSRDRIRVKEYAPNYTGRDEREWCDECQSWGIPHVHVWK